MREKGELLGAPPIPAVNPVPQRPKGTSAVAAASQASGMSRINALARSISNSAIQNSSSTPRQPQQSTTPPEIEDLEEADRQAVEDEIKKWEDGGVLCDGHPEYKDFDLLRFWQVCGLYESAASPTEISHPPTG